MAQWYSFVRSQEDTTASVSVDVGIDAARDVPTHPLLFLLVRRLDDGADPAPIRALEEQLHSALATADMCFVGTLTMSGSRTMLVYGNDESRLNEIMAGIDVPFAIKSQPDPEWQIYRTLLPTEAEIAPTD